MRVNFTFVIIVGFLLLQTACNSKPAGNASQEIPATAKWIYPEYSNLFQIAISKGDTFLLLKDPADTAKDLHAICWGTGSANYVYIKRISSGRKMVVTTAVFVCMLESLRKEKLIIGVDNGDYITSPITALRIQKGEVASIAKSGELSHEAIAKLNPDLIIAYFIDQKGRENAMHAQRNGTTVLFFQNFLETHPLGRAEWIKVFGFLTGQSEKANNQFEEIKEHYQNAVLIANEAKTNPTVLINAPFSGTWDIPAGGSYMAALIADAGGQYLWSDVSGTGRIPISIEKVYSKAKEADIWINPGACQDFNCLQNIDPRVVKFSSFQQKNIFNCTKTINKNGANQYWEYGVLRPDLVLQDLVQIFHPEIPSENPLIFFEKLHN